VSSPLFLHQINEAGNNRLSAPGCTGGWLFAAVPRITFGKKRMGVLIGEEVAFPKEKGS
jgi:hypothetical protein